MNDISIIEISSVRAPYTYSYMDMLQSELRHPGNTQVLGLNAVGDEKFADYSWQINKSFVPPAMHNNKVINWIPGNGVYIIM